MVHVVDAAGEDGAEDLQRGEHLLQRGAAQQDVGGLGHVSSVQVVVIRNILDSDIIQSVLSCPETSKIKSISMVDKF